MRHATRLVAGRTAIRIRLLFSNADDVGADSRCVRRTAATANRKIHLGDEYAAFDLQGVAGVYAQPRKRGRLAQRGDDIPDVLQFAQVGAGRTVRRALCPERRRLRVHEDVAHDSEHRRDRRARRSTPPEVGLVPARQIHQ